MGDDRLRPLDEEGKRQAKELVKLLADSPAHRVLSSPYLRCVQTVEPLARLLGVKVETTEDLAEGAGLRRFFGLLGRHEGTDLILCGHADLVEELLEHLIEDGIVEPSKAKLAKASTWELRTKGGRIAAARYIPAP